MIVKVSREFVIKAIEEEVNLVEGEWVKAPDDAGKVPRVDDPACQVCAVGAVLRRVLEPSQPYAVIATAADEATEMYGISDEEDVWAEAQALVAEGKTMAALSVYFEQLSEDYAGPEVRRRLVDFVRRYFPEDVTIDIDEAEAAEGVEVVRE